MTKAAYWILGIGIVLFAAIMGGVWLLTRPAPNTGNTTAQQGGNSGLLYPVSVTVTSTAGQNGATTTTTTTGSLNVRDFLKDPDTKPVPSNPGQYFLGYTVDPSSTAAPSVPYTITYYEQTQFFNIALLQEPISSSRHAAEQYLMQHLGISEAQMCQLHYQVSVPAYVNGTYAGTSLGFSFCPGAVQLP